MAKIAFDEIETPNETQLAVTQLRQLATVTDSPLTQDQEEKGLIGDWNKSHSRPPRINLVNKSGGLADVFTPGIWILNKEHALSALDPKDKKKGQPLRIITLTMLLQYQENIKFEDREVTPARIFNSKDQVIAAGGAVGYRKEANVFSELATVELLVQASDAISDEADPLFSEISEDGNRYVRAVATFGGTAFGTIAIPLATSLRHHLKDCGLKGGQWDLGSVLVTKNINSWWTPTIRTAGLVTEDQKRLIDRLP